jgi:raffinose/stachyose/melibiose transport system permease protein
MTNIDTGARKSTGTRSPKKVRSSTSLKRIHDRTFALMILPALLVYAIFFLYPTLSNLRFAFTQWDGFAPATYIGLDNFTRSITNDDIFRKVLGNNVEFSFLVIIFQTGLSLLFAIFLLKNTRASIALRTLYFFPTILSSVSVALVWMFIYEPNLGALNTLLRNFGFDSLALSWLGSETITLRAIAFTQVWFHTGQMMVVYIAGLQQIPRELYEAAEVDGATRWQQFKSVTWPMALPTTAVVMAYTTIQSFRAFDLIYTMTGGGPNNSTNILVTLIYQAAFGEYRFGYAASLSVYLVIFILLLTWLQRRILRTKY